MVLQALHRLVATLVAGETDKVTRIMAQNQAEQIREIQAGRSARSAAGADPRQSEALTGGLDAIVARLEVLHFKLQGQANATAAAPVATAAACAKRACPPPTCAFQEHKFTIGGVVLAWAIISIIFDRLFVS